MNLYFNDDQFLLKRQVLALTGKLRFYNLQGQLVFFGEQKMFKLKEDIRLYSDETKNQELLNIQARQILDYSAYYDVIDSQYLTKIGGFRRKGFRSMIRDEWEVFDNQDVFIGVLTEDSLSRALVRRLLLGTLLPQKYNLTLGNECLAGYKQRFNIFRYELEIDFQMDHDHKLDHRLGIAAATLLAIIEGRQSK
jgi:hypothetical protein